MKEVEKIGERTRKTFKTSQCTTCNHVNSVDNKGEKCCLLTLHLKDEVFQTEANSRSYRTTTTAVNLWGICYFLQQEGKKICCTELIYGQPEEGGSGAPHGPWGKSGSRCGGGHQRGHLWVPFSHRPPNARAPIGPQGCGSQTPKCQALGGEHSIHILHSRKNVG